MNAQYMLTAPRVTDTFFGTGITITSADMISTVKSEESVNPGDDLSFGGCVIPTAEFEMRDPGDTVSEIAGRSFVWYKNILTERFTEKKLAVSAKVKMVAWNPSDKLNPSMAYVVSSITPYVTIYNTDTMTPVTTIPDFTDVAPEALVMDGFTLYALYSKEPYVAKYNLGFDGDAPALQTTPALSAYNIEQIKGMCDNRKCLCRAASGGFSETTVDTKNGRAVAVSGAIYTEEKIGYYIAQKPEKVNGGKIKVQCNGWLSKFDIAIDEWLEALEYPLTLKELITKLCGKAGVTFKDSEFPNQDYPVQRNFISSGLSALQVLRWATELAGSFAWMGGDGSLNLGWYKPVGVTIDKSAYLSITTAEYETLPIDRFQIRVVENDVGVIVPPDAVGDNAYVIQDNPLAYTETDAELRPAVEALYARVEGLTYRPFEIKTFQNPYIKAGNTIIVAMPNGTEFVGYVMSKSTSGGTDTLVATGNQKRELQTDSINQEIRQVRGTVHKLDMTVDGLRSTVESVQGDYVSKTTFETAVDGITLEVSKKLNEDEFGTKLRVSAEDVQIAWNSIDRAIQFVDGSLQILDTEKPENEQLLVRFDETASHYYYNGYEVGRIGTNSYITSEDLRGITFQLQNQGAYMAWSVQPEEGGDDTPMWMFYINKPDEMGYPGVGVYIADMYVGTKTLGFLLFRHLDNGGGGLWDEDLAHGVGPSIALDGICTYYLKDANTASAYTVFNQDEIVFYTDLNMNNNNILNESDERLKTNIQPTETSALQKIIPMDFKQFDWIENESHEELGLIAQQVELFFPEAVNTDPKTGIKSLNTTKFVMYALKAIQELAQYMNAPALMDNNYWEDTMTLDEKKAFNSGLPSRDFKVSRNTNADTVKGI